MAARASAVAAAAAEGARMHSEAEAAASAARAARDESEPAPPANTFVDVLAAVELARQLNGGAAKMYRSQLRSSHEQLGALTKQVLDGQRKAERDLDAQDNARAARTDAAVQCDLEQPAFPPITKKVELERRQSALGEKAGAIRREREADAVPKGDGQGHGGRGDGGRRTGRAVQRGGTALSGKMIEENVMYAPPKEEGGGGRIDNQGRSPAARRASPDAEDWSEAGKARGRSKSGCDQSDPRLGEQGDWVACGLVWKAPLTESYP